MSTFDELWRMADELRDVLPIFTLTEDERREIVSHMRARTFDAAEVVYHLGDPGDDPFVVHHGLAKSVFHTADGREVLIGLHGKGEFFGALQLFAHVPTRESTVIATARTTVLQIAADDARHVIQCNPKAMAFMYRRYGELSVRLSTFIARLVSQDVHGRVAWMLLELAHLREGVSLSQEEIADMIGATRRSVNAALADLARRSLVDVQPLAVRVLDEAGLRADLGEVLGQDEDAFFHHLDDVLFRDR